MSKQLRANLLTPQGLAQGTLSFGAIINDIVIDDTVQTAKVNKDAPYILPGFIDTHVHGGGGADTMDGADGVRTLAQFHLSHGTSTLYPTTITNPWDNIIAALQGVKTVMASANGLPSIPGVHLEGPFISPQRLGAQPPNALEPEQEKLDELLALDVIRLLTLAPEIGGAATACQQFVAANVRLSVGHSRASFEEVMTIATLVQQAGGTLGFTHLYNAMGGLAGREPGIVGAALANPDAYAELIFDEQHVHRGSFLAALHAKPEHLTLISDAIRAAGMPEGETELGGQRAVYQDGAVRLADGTLAGSVLTLDTALKNAVAAGVPLLQCSHLLSRNPARYMGLADRGELVAGKRADLVVLDTAFNVLEVYVAGQKLVG